jgi:hypothetical protein
MMNDASLDKALEQLRSILIEGETLEAWAVQRRLFALTHRRDLIAATTGRFIALRRGLFGGFDISNFRWQDVRDATLRVGPFAAALSLITSNTSDLAMDGLASRMLNFVGFRKEQTQRIYRLAQGHDQAWREKRRIRELEELRAKSGGYQFAPSGAPSSAVPTAPNVGDAVARLQQAKQMLEARLISDSEYEAMKARIIGSV